MKFRAASLSIVHLCAPWLWLLVALPGVAASAGEPPLPSSDALRQLRRLEQPRLSPDGRQVLMRVVDSSADGGRGHLFLTQIDAGAARQLTFSPPSDKQGEGSAQWLPDGRSVLFIAHRGERTSLYQLALAGGEARTLAVNVPVVADDARDPLALPPAAPGEALPGAVELAADVVAFRPSPDGRLIALTARDPETPGEKRQKDARADAAWVDHGLHHVRLYLLEIATARLLPVPLGGELDVGAFAWSADGHRLVALAEGGNHAADLGPATETWLIEAAEPTHARRLAGMPPTVSSAVWSLDGKRLLFVAQAEQDAPPGYSALYDYELANGVIHAWPDPLDGNPAGAPMALAGGEVLLGVERGLDVSMVRYGAKRGVATTLALPAAVVSEMDSNAMRRGWVFLASSGGQPSALYYAASLGGPLRVLLTPALSPSPLRSVAPQRLQWEHEGRQLQGLLYMPSDRGQQRVPLVLEVHGGPLGAYFDHQDPFADFLVGQGWAVLRVNPRGSAGRGAAFAAANKNDLGGGDYRDLMSAVDRVLASEPIDPARLALVGYSYGGEMAAFVEGSTDRFRAIVSGAPVIDQYSEYGTEDSSWYDRWYFGKPWQRSADAWRQSPLSRVVSGHTPFLLLQGEADVTDPLGQSQEMYRALRQSGVPVELVTYPREDHGPLAQAIYAEASTEPWHGHDARRRIVAFIQRAFGTAP